MELTHRHRLLVLPYRSRRQDRRLDLPENNSDHYPIACAVGLFLDRAVEKEDRTVSSRKVNWKKVD